MLAIAGIRAAVGQDRTILQPGDYGRVDAAELGVIGQKPYLAGAAGGTVIHAKGTGMEGAEKFLGISLAAEKEMIYIVVHRDKRNEIMSAIMRDAGMASKAKSICFTLPVSATAGLRLIEED